MATHRNVSDDSVMEVTWEDVQAEVRRCNPELHGILQALNPGRKYTFVKVRYPFGAPILQAGKLHFPQDPQQQSSALCDALKKRLNYTSVPLALMMNKACEVYYPFFDRIVPLNLLEPGGILFGLFEVVGLLSGLTSSPPWCVNAGARSVFMLPKITDQSGHKRLRKKFNALHLPPDSLWDQHALFTEIMSHPEHQGKWSCDVLFFTETWFEKTKSNYQKLKDFYHHLFQKYCERTWYLMNETEMQLTWQTFAAVLGKRNLKPRPYLMDTLKHLVVLASGGLPGFVLGDQSDLLAPANILQQEYIETYGLKDYLPTLVTPHKLGFCQGSQSVYYSLSFPTLREAMPDFKTPIPIIDDVRDIKLMVETLYKALRAETIQSADIRKAIEGKEFEFFHSGEDVYGEIAHTGTIPEGDVNVRHGLKQDPDRTFCSTGPFLSGCIRVSDSKSLF